MHLIRSVRAWLRRGRNDDQLREEVLLHIELRRQALIDEGMDPRDADYEARRMFGNVTAIREEVRDMWSLTWCEDVLQDARYGARMLRRAPLFTAIAIASLASGIGAAAAVFNVADAVLFRPLSVSAPQRLRAFGAVLTFGAATKAIGGADEDTFAAMQRGTDFGDLVGFRTLDDVPLAGGAGPRPVRAEAVSGNYFQVLGLSVTQGRGLAPSDERSSPIAVVLTERMWRSAFNGDPLVSGRPMTLNGIPATVAGVVRDFSGLIAERPADVFVPLAATTVLDPAAAASQIRVVIRPHPGIATPEAEARLAGLYSGAGPSLARGGELRVTLSDASRGVSDARPALERPLALGLGLVGVLLLVAATNTGALILSRYASRQGEFAVRVAIGAGRGRLIRQLIVEALLLAGLAAVTGMFAASIAAPLLMNSIPGTEGAPAFDLRFDWRLVAFTALTAAAAALAAAAASVFHVVRPSATRLRGATVRNHRTSALLVAGQVACSLLMLVGAGAMSRTLVNLQNVDPGFNADGVLAIRVNMSGRAADPAALHGYYSALQARIAAAPHVSRVGLAQFGLMTGASTTGTVEVPGFAPAGDEDRWTLMFFVGGDFFETMGIPLLAGRAISRADARGSRRVAVVNRRFAEFYFGEAGRALGRTINGNVDIVGIVADARYSTLRGDSARAMFIPFTQAPPRTSMTFVVRPAGDAAGAASSVVAAITAHDPQLRPAVTAVAEHLSAAVARERFVAALAAVLAAMALFLSCAGLYSMSAHAVIDRRAEIGVRMALGATRGDVVRLLLRRPLAATTAGILVGLPGAWAAMRAVRSLLFGVGPFDILTVLGAALLLFAVGALAGLPAARRAAAIDPQESLRWG